MAASKPGLFFLDAFALRQWKGARGISMEPEAFVHALHRRHYDTPGGLHLIDGYAPFCKHVFVDNFLGLPPGDCSIDEQNAHLLRTGYAIRQEGELPVLSRWFLDRDVEVRKADRLDIILYSREQLLLEHEALRSARTDPSGREPRVDLPDAPWGIISIKAQDVDHELPMQPITSMRNALGKEEGGSGVPLDREAYFRSVSYWKDRAPVLAEDPKLYVEGETDPRTRA